MTESFELKSEPESSATVLSVSATHTVFGNWKVFFFFFFYALVLPECLVGCGHTVNHSFGE